MKLKSYYLLTILFSLNLLSNEKDIKENIEKILPPEAKIESIEKSIFPGIYKVFYGDLQPLYVSEDGKLFIYGDMFQISENEILNITDKEIAYKRNEILKELDQSTLISFLSDKESHRITVFTDVDCGYCRKLHDQIGEYNKLGISIDYAAYPRSGIGTNAFTKMVSAWCSVNPHKALTDLKKGKEINVKFCENQPIAKHYTIGKKIGISGTPAIITSSGELLPGYISPDELYKRLRG